MQEEMIYRESACYCFVAAVALSQSWREQNLEGTKIVVDYCLHTLYKIYIGILHMSAIEPHLFILFTREF